MTDRPEGRQQTILFVAVPAQLGGSNKSLSTVMTAFEGRARRVLAAPGSGPFRSFAAERGIADVFIPLPSGSRWARIRASITLARLIWSQRKDITCIHAQALTGLNLVVPGVVLSGTPVAVRVSDPVGSRWGRVLGPVIRRLVRDLRVVPVSDVAAAVAVANGLCRPGEVQIVPDPVDPDEVKASSPTPSSSAVRIGFLGGASHRKGWDTLLEVIRTTLDLDIVWKIFVAPENAEGDLSDAAFPQGRVDLVGRVTDVREAYADCDVVFVPSRDESFCLVVVEAMINGLPVVATDLAPIKMHVGDSECGLLFPSGDAKKAEEAVRSLVVDEALRRRLGDVGPIRAKVYEPKAIAGRLADIYGVEAL